MSMLKIIVFNKKSKRAVMVINTPICEDKSQNIS